MMQDLTHEEIEELNKKGVNTVLVIISSTEQHGPHLPISTDERIGEIIGKRLAKEVNGLVAPIIRPGCSSHHKDFSGTISLSSKTLMNLVRDYFYSLLDSGFKNIVLLSTHGGNCAPVMTLASDLSEEIKSSKKFDDVNIIPLSDLEKHLSIWIEAAEEFGINPNDIKHAGAAETSILLAENKDLVRENKIKKGFTGDLEKSSLFTNGIKEYSKNGVLGDPEKASKEVGEKLVDAMVNYFSEKILKEIQ